MQPEIVEKRGPGRPRKIVSEPAIVDRMASALAVFDLDLTNVALVYRALWSAGLSYSETIPHLEKAIAVAQARASRH